MAKKAIGNDADFDFNLADTFIGQSFQNDPTFTPDETSDLSLPDLSNGILSRKQLIQEQQHARDLAHLLPQAVSEQEATIVPVCFYYNCAHENVTST